MASRPTIADLAQHSGVSVATVDRVLNGRLPVREATAHRVLEAAEAIGFHAAGLIGQRLAKPRSHYRLGFVLQRRNQSFYQAFAATIEETAREVADFTVTPTIDYLDTQTPDEICARLRAMGERADAVAMVSIDHPSVTAVVSELKAKGVAVFSMLSDFAPGVRQGYVGLNNRQVGRTAAWLIAHTAKQTGTLGIFVGSHRFVGQEMREIGFRSYFREIAPNFQVLDAQVNLEAGNIAHEATLTLLRKHADLAGLYIAGGGMEGAIAALREEGIAGQIAVVCNENTEHTRGALADGVISAVISTPLVTLCRQVINLMAQAVQTQGTEAPSELFLPFSIVTPENI